MSRLVGVEIDSQQVRMLIARRGRGSVLEVERAVSFDASSSPCDAQPEDLQQWAVELAGRVEELKLGRPECLVAISRSEAEIRRMRLPMVPDEELPDMVRLQAVSEFASFSEQWLLDYVPLPSAPEAEERQVLAATLRPIAQQRWKLWGAATGMAAHRMVFSPAAATRLAVSRLVERGVSAEQLLVVQPHRDAFSITVADHGIPLLVRWVRRSSESSEGALEADARLLSTEIQRTLTSASTQFDGIKVTTVALFWDRKSGPQLQEQLQISQGLKIELIDPFDSVEIAEAPAGEVQRGEFAGLIGMLTDQLSEVPPQLDFLQPRRRPEAPDRRRLYWLLAATAATIVLGIAGLIGWQLSKMTDEVVRIQGEIASAKKEIEKITGAEVQLKAWADWESEHVNWLDEMARLSEKLPPPDAVKLKQVVATVRSRSGGGTLTVEGMARQPEAIDRLDRELSDGQHRVEGKNTGKDGTDPKYPWKFTESIVVIPPVAADQTVSGPQDGQVSEQEAAASDGPAAADAEPVRGEASGSADSAPAVDGPVEGGSVEGGPVEGGPEESGSVESGSGAEVDGQGDVTEPAEVAEPGGEEQTEPAATAPSNEPASRGKPEAAREKNRYTISVASREAS